MSENKNSQPPQELTVSEPRTIEYDIPYIQLPQGDQSGEMGHNEASSEQLKEFFTPEMISRLVYCPQINVDQTDNWGSYGYEPGYIFVNSSNYKGAQTFNDDEMLHAETFDSFTTKNGFNVLKLVKDHYDFFPQAKFNTQIITAEKYPKTFIFLRNLLDGVEPNDISTYPIEDLNYMYEDLWHGKLGIDVRVEQTEEYAEEQNNLINDPINNFIPTYIDHRGIEVPMPEYNDDKEKANLQKRIEEIDEWKLESPGRTLKRLQLVEEFQKRNLIPNHKFFASFEEENDSIKKDIEQAKISGNNELAEGIENTFNKTKFYLENNTYKKLNQNQEDIKLLTDK
ncbi:MAG: hypothetical protein WCG91_00425 [Candidatus Shapirobacteria bacterium]